jgi:hypothetical protein
MLAGSLLALLVYLAYSWTRKRVVHSKFDTPYRKHGAMFAGCIAIYLAAVILFSSLLSTLPH